MELPSKISLAQLGTKAADVNDLVSWYENKTNAAMEHSIKLREPFEANAN